MINKFLNVTFNSFFRTLGRFLFYILIALLVYFCVEGFPTVHATTGSGWGANKNIQYSIVTYSKSGSTINTVGAYFTGTTGSQDEYYPVQYSTIEANKNFGVGVQYSFIKGNIYYANLYLCSASTALNTGLNVSLGSVDTLSAMTSNTSYSYITRASMSPQPFGSLSNFSASNCYSYIFAFVPKSNQPWAGLNFNSVTTGQKIYIVGLDISNGGLYTSVTNEQIQETIKTEMNELQEKQDKTNEKLGEIDSTLNNSDTSGAENQAGGFFSNFKDSDYGLSDVITMPLEVIKNITSSRCSPLVLPIPFVDTNVTLPCMNTIYSQYFGNILTIYQTITTGMIAYWVCINIFATVKGFKDPESDNVEVMEL